jgi:chemotaxis protein methyltransferase WspC
LVQIAIEALLRQKIGLDVASIGSSAIARAVRQRLAATANRDLQTYLNHLHTSPEELQELIELAIVPETWFFRDREPFKFLGSYVISEWLPIHQGGILRVLSVPCSTGEEPYSIAIALMEAGLAAKNFHIDAVDISKKSLIKAQRAVYSKNSFRGHNLDFREHYFQQVGDEFQLCESIRSTVNFLHGNLLDFTFSVDNNYHVIFCRNLLIYFDNSARKQTMHILDGLLAQKGILFLGHAETGEILPDRFVPVSHSLAFAYRKVEHQPQSKVVEVGLEDHLWRKQITLPQAQVSNNLMQDVSRYPSHTSDRPTQPSLLETARTLADRGQLDEAATLCEKYLSQNRVSAEAHLLLGEVCQAMGKDEQAEECFNKTIYLEPNNYEALIHLALLKERRGDFSSAEVIRQRIQRLHKL